MFRFRMYLTRMKTLLKSFLVVLFVLVLSHTYAQKSIAKEVKITILSTMLAEAGIGEWGFAALVEVDTFKLLFDTGNKPQTVLENLKELNIDLSGVTHILLSHSHNDHTGGWISMRRALQAINMKALTQLHVGQGFFYERVLPSGDIFRGRTSDSSHYIALGGQIHVHKTFTEILPGMFVTGPVPRVHPEKNYGMGGKPGKVKVGNAIVDDTVPEDMSLIINTAKGLIVVSGCGHAGIINTIEHARKYFKGKEVLAAIGGFHLFDKKQEALNWTATNLKKAGVKHFIGAHCTGIEAVYQLRQLMGLQRATCVVGAVGASYTLSGGINPGLIAR
jgi:7,8-dihydropterin-6-yl-methyl-4-(beta-D-ribofuranosyl)aminobenzene 5'-phosphate synthase